MVWAGSSPRFQAFTGTQRRRQPGDAQHQNAEHRAENDQQQGREKADRTADLNEYEQLQHREQQKSNKKGRIKRVPQRKNALQVHTRCRHPCLNSS